MGLQVLIAPGGAAVINKWAGQCSECGASVPAGEGEAYKAKGATRWSVKHGECPTAAPVAQSATAGYPATAEQLRAVELFMTRQPLVIRAFAGAGKTSTLTLLGEAAAGEGRRGILTAFNKKIIVAAGEKMPRNVQAFTMHKLAYDAVGYRYRVRARKEGKRRIKSPELAAILGAGPFTIKFGAGTRTLAAGYLAGLAMATVTKFCQTGDLEIGERHVPYIEGIDEPTEAGDRTWANNREVRRYVMPAVRRAWADLCRTDEQGGGRLQFEPNHSLKLFQLGTTEGGVRTPAHIDADFVFVDEAQDLAEVMLAIIMDQAGHAQLVFVGDSYQAINEWMGAVDALDKIEALGGNVTFLSQSFRFGPAVADVANGLLARLGSPLPLEGFGKVASTVGPLADPECILTRTNAEAVRQLLYAVRAGRKPFLVGGAKEVRDFAEGARELQAGRRTDHHDLGAFDTWAEVQEYVEKDEQGGELRLMVKLVDDFGTETILEAVNGVATEAAADLMISTTHKAKGLEWETVQLAGDFFKPKPGESGLPVAEMRLLYVAVTRGKLGLDVSATPQVFPGRAVQTAGSDEAPAVQAQEPLDAVAALRRAEALLGAERDS